jgi:dTDP-4-dehydrorhamnose reductase
VVSGQPRLVGGGMRWLVTGAGGMLGRDLTRLLRAVPGASVHAFTRAELDVCDAGAVAAALRAVRPDVVVNCAAWTDVDAAERDEARAMAVNAYGRAKLAGEQAALGHGHYVVRTAWLYGAHGRSFARTMAVKAAEGAPVRVVDDQVGQPTWTVDLAERLILLGAGHLPPGVYHVTNAGTTSWYGYARRIFELAGADPGLVEPVSTAGFPRPARRPAYSVLGDGAWRPPVPMRDWRTALDAAWPHLVAAWGGVVSQAAGVGGQ